MNLPNCSEPRKKWRRGDHVSHLTHLSNQMSNCFGLSQCLVRIRRDWGWITIWIHQQIGISLKPISSRDLHYMYSYWHLVTVFCWVWDGNTSWQICIFSVTVGHSSSVSGFYIYTYTYIHAHLCIHTRIYIHTYIHTHTCTYNHTYIDTYICTHVRTGMCMNSCDDSYEKENNMGWFFYIPLIMGTHQSTEIKFSLAL